MNDIMIEKVNDALVGAKAITWDTCHKIYILMDDEQVELMEGYGYEPIIMSEGNSTEYLSQIVQDWYDTSCFLKFVQAVSTNLIDPNEGFTEVIAQGGDEDEDD